MKVRFLFLIILSLNISMLWGQKPELGIPTGPSSRFIIAEFSPNGKNIATVSSKEQVARIWDIETGKLLHTLVGHINGGIKSVSYSPNGKAIVTACDSHLHGPVKIWDAENGKLLYSLDGWSLWVNSATYSPDGKTIVTASADKISKIWDAENGKLLHTLEGHTSYVNSATYSPDGKTIVTGSDDCTSKIWDAKNGNLLHSLEGHTDDIISAIYSPDGKTIVTASDDHMAKIWDAENGNLLHSLEGHTKLADPTIYSPDGKTIVTASDDHMAKIWDAKTWKLLIEFGGPPDNIYNPIYSPDGKTIVATSDDGTSKIWDIKTGKLLHTLEGNNTFEEYYYDYVNLVTYSPNSKIIVTTAADNNAKLWDAETGKLLHSLSGHEYHIISATFSPNGKTIVTASYDRIAKIWDAENGKLLQTLEGHTAMVNSVTYSSDSKIIVTASCDKTAKIWDVETGILLHSLEGHTSDVITATFSPDGKTIVSASDDNTAKIWDSETGKLLYSFEGHADDINSAIYSPDGKTIVTVSDDGTAKLWDAETGKLLPALRVHTNIIEPITFSPDGKKIITSNVFGGVEILDAETGDNLYNLKGHTSIIRSATFSPNGKTIVTASCDNTAKIWDAETGKFLLSLEGHVAPVNSAIFNLEGKIIITSSDDGSIILWDAKTGKMFVQQFVIDGKETVTIYKNGLFDATPGAMEQMYFVQGLEIIELNQLKDRYWEPDLWKKVMDGEELRDVEAFGESLPLFPKIENLVIKKETLEFDLLDQGGGIGKYFIFINGKEAFVGNDLKNEEVYKDSVIKVNFNFKNHEYLIPGDSNKITVKAYNAENYIISRGANVLYSNTKKKEIIQPSIFIIACGVSDYTGNQIDLRYAAKDAEDISNSLKLGADKLFGIDKTFTYLLSTNGEKEYWPSKENIENTFKEISTKAKSTDIIVVYLSGHGINWGGQDGDFYYLTQDAYTASGDAYNDPAIRKASTISSNELVELFKLVPANKQVLIIDACASGQVVEDLLAQRDISSSTIRALDRMKDRTGMYIITGSAADAVSYEASKYGQGLLTYSLLEGIKGAALREGQFIDIDLLFQRAKDRVPQLAEGIGGIQQPQVFFPYGSASFDIGLLTETEKELIPLAKEKPVFVMSTFMDAENYGDDLGLESLIDEELRTISAKGSVANLIFYEAKKFPDAYQLRGQYTISGNEITLNLNIFYGKEKIESIEIGGDKKNIEAFVDNILEEICQIVIK